jgi:putative intracellular protease/amidase
MSADLNVLNPERPKRILMVASNPAVSKQTGWPIGFWWGELSHAYWEFAESGYQIDIVSPDGGDLEADAWSDPRDDSGYSADDLISLGFLNSPEHAALLQKTKSLADVAADVTSGSYDAVFLVGGQGPMYTFLDDDRIHDVLRTFYESGKVTAVVCHATCVLLKTRLSTGELLVNGKTWTGFANTEEDYADAYVGQRIQPFRIEVEAKKLPDTNFVVDSRFKSHAVRDGLLVTGQQQYSATPAARLVIEAIGV